MRKIRENSKYWELLALKESRAPQVRSQSGWKPGQMEQRRNHFGGKHGIQVPAGDARWVAAMAKDSKAAKRWTLNGQGHVLEIIKVLKNWNQMEMEIHVQCICYISRVTEKRWISLSSKENELSEIPWTQVELLGEQVLKWGNAHEVRM